jgi:murein DD-endopeptidase MepM/ murein hydrolase activator NlpD
MLRLGDAPREADARSIEEAARKLEAVLLRQLIASSGVFKGGEAAGGRIRSDMFVEALSDAVANAGGIGIARMLEQSLEATGAGGREGVLSEGPAERPAPAMGLLRAGSTPLAPLTGPVTSGFGRRVDPIDGDVRFHTGVDLAAPAGTPVHAVLPGVVRSVGQRGGYGQAVEVDHGGGLTTLYAHNSHLIVEPGQKVEGGQELALSGATGRATGAHLHLEVRKDGRPVEPRRALNAYGIRAEHSVAGKPHPPLKEGMP